MPLRVLIAAAGGPGGLGARAVADALVRGVLSAAPDAVAVRAPRTGRPPEPDAFDLVLAAGISARTAALVARAAELGVAAVILGGALHGASSASYPAGLVAFEPGLRPGAIDVGTAASVLRHGASGAMQLVVAGRPG